MVTILDAHPDIAMSYELYPHLLDPLIGNEDKLEFFRKSLSSEKNWEDKTLIGAASDENYVSKKKLRTFVARCFRGGLIRADLLDILVKFATDSEPVICSENFSVQFIEACAQTKMCREGKKFWGMKCTGAYPRYMEAWPEAKYLNIVRDGRDLLASQLLTGSFDKTVTEVAQGYSSSHRKFTTYMDKSDFEGMNVFYEQLVEESEQVVKKICHFFSLEYTDEMLRFYDKDLTIYKNSMGHLSIDRISKPIDASQIGRWRRELTEQQVSTFCETAGDTLRAFSYL